MEAKFVAGRILMTPGVLALSLRLEPEGFLPGELLRRHLAGDWGDLTPDDVAENERALIEGTRLLSSYNIEGGATVWIITEADRSVTTLLLPEEY